MSANWNRESSVLEMLCRGPTTFDAADPLPRVGSDVPIWVKQLIITLSWYEPIDVARGQGRNESCAFRGSASSFRARGVSLQMNEWSKDAQGNLRTSAVIDWKAEAFTADGSGDVVLRIEFSVDPEQTDVSSLQFRLSDQQARSMGAALCSASNQASQSSDLIFRSARQRVRT